MATGLGALLAGCVALLQGAVASSEPHASRAAAQVLAGGGNAVDAAVAASFALAVTLPEAGNVGGGGFLLYRDPDGQSWFLDFREVAPAAAHPELYAGAGERASILGWLAAAVPGSVPGMAEAHRRWGSRPWPELLAPAIALAEKGIPISAQQHARLQEEAAELSLDPLAAALFLEAPGRARPAGARMRQPQLAATLRLVAERGEAAFRDGPVVEELLRACREGGGILQAQDFRDYQPRLRPVHQIPWKGMTVLAATPPSSGAIFLHQCLYGLERFPLRVWGFGDPRTVHLIGEAEAYAFAERNRWLGDPAGFDFDYGALVAEEHLRARSRRLSPRRSSRPAHLRAASGGAARAAAESEDTTHYSIVDEMGGACAVTTTLNGWYGAKVMAPGGFFLNNEMDDFAAAPGVPNQFGLVQGAYNAVVAGRRPLSSMSPVIVVKDGAVDAVIGSPGGATILTTVLQVLLNRYEFLMSPERAVAAPRFHRQDHPPHLRYEAPLLSLSALDRLRAIGQPLLRRATPLGDVNAVFRTARGWDAVSDPRTAGLAVEL